MPTLFTRTTSNSKPNSYKYNDKYGPDAIIFFIGANDFSNIFKPKIQQFISGYYSMLQEIAKAQINYLNNRPKLINICDAGFSKLLCD